MSICELGLCPPVEVHRGLDVDGNADGGTSVGGQLCLHLGDIGIRLEAGSGSEALLHKLVPRAKPGPCLMEGGTSALGRRDENGTPAKGLSDKGSSACSSGS